MAKTLFETYARGKLLITGEYAVLDGALALAVPVQRGQSLHAQTSAPTGCLRWRALDEQGYCWLEALISLHDFEVQETNDPPTAAGLQNLLRAARNQNPDFLTNETNAAVETRTDFPRAWGLGTSSTLVAAMAKWAAVSPYRLLADSFGGSGYDVACAYANGPVLYRRSPDGSPEVRPVAFHPPFTKQLYFVYLGQKQDSRTGIKRYRAVASEAQTLAAALSTLTEQALRADTLSEFEQVLETHEQRVAEALQLPRAKDRYFKDYWGVVKSLGAWGGDFVLATSARTPEETRAYFNDLGFQVFIPWNELAL
ncbi:MAG: GYDIA family GHMP kinase [Saprospiraceae bacterium]